MKAKNVLIIAQFLAGAFYGLVCNAQPPIFNWAVSVGGTDKEVCYSVASDTSGNVYATGYYIDTVDFDPGLPVYNLVGGNTNHLAAFVTKMDKNHNLIWAKSFYKSTENIIAKSITTDKNNNIYVLGLFTGTVTFDTKTITAFGSGSYDHFVLKLDVMGNVLWAQRLMEPRTIVSNEYCSGDKSIAVSSNGSVFVTGSKEDQTNPVLPERMFVTRLNSFGGLSQSEYFSAGSCGKSIAIDKSNNLYVTGYFAGTVDFNPGAPTFNLNSYNTSASSSFVLKLSSSVQFVWAHRYGKSNANNTKYWSQGYSISTDNLGNVYTTGYIWSGPISGPYTTFNFYYRKLNSSLVEIWGYNNQPNSFFIHPLSIAVDADYNTYITGYHRGYNNLGNGIILKAVGNNDAFVLKADTAGTIIWADSVGTTSNTTGFNWCTGYSVFVEKNNIYIGGTINGTTNKGMSYNGSGPHYDDVFVAKWNQPCLPKLATYTITACGSYTRSAKTYATSGIYKDTTTNSIGCDSLLTLNVTIKNNTYATLTVSSCSSHVLNDSIYTASGIYTQTISNSFGCDSIITLNLTIRNISSTILTQTSCATYTLNGQMYTSSGVYTQTLNNVVGCDSLLTLNLTIPIFSLILNTVDTSVCLGQSVTLSASGANSYSWSSNVQNGTAFVPSASQTYSVTGTDINGCSGTSAITVSVTPYPGLIVSGPSAAICAGTPAVLKAVGAHGYLWLPTNQTADSIIVAPLATTTYTVFGNNNNLCYDTAFVSIAVNPLPTVTLDLSNIDTLCFDNSSYGLTGGLPSGGVYTGNGVFPPWFIVQSAGLGLHPISYTYTDGNGCTNTASEHILVDACSSVEESLVSKGLVAYPNPATNELTVNYKQGKGKLTIYTGTGLVVLQVEIQNSITQLDISELPGGVYILEAQEKTTREMLKIVKQ